MKYQLSQVHIQWQSTLAIRPEKRILYATHVSSVLKCCTYLKRRRVVSEYTHMSHHRQKGNIVYVAKNDKSSFNLPLIAKGGKYRIVSFFIIQYCGEPP